MFFFHDPPPAAIFTLSLHDALPISPNLELLPAGRGILLVEYGSNDPAESRASAQQLVETLSRLPDAPQTRRSEEHTSELQSPCNLVCRLLLEKKKVDKSLIHNVRDK